MTLGHVHQQDVLRRSLKLQKKQLPLNPQALKKSLLYDKGISCSPQKPIWVPIPFGEIHSYWVSEIKVSFSLTFWIGIDLCIFLCSVTKPISILCWFSDLQFQHNIPICLGLINLSVDFYFLKVTSSYTSFTNHKQTSPFTKSPSL